jgi:hypothetical protein
VKSIKATFRAKTILPIAIGGGAGVAGIAAFNEWIAPRITNPKIAALVEGMIGIAGLPLLNRAYQGAGLPFAGFMGGHALSKIVQPLLPFGQDMAEAEVSPEAEIDAVAELGSIEYIGDLDDDEADELVGGDGGVEQIEVDDDGGGVLVDGLGFFPPMPLPFPLPPKLARLIKRKELAWLFRLGLPRKEVLRVLRLKPAGRRAALAKLRARYKRKRLGAKRRRGPGRPRPPRRPRGRRPVPRPPRRRRPRRRRGVHGFDDDDGIADLF